ncbi:MAG: site-specific integrase [Candidatus Burarchaeum sp.]|nr:site-specific integrase [Candidatus Burarchaeum sp.]MDO8339080.1 site-specific integrase [Candidatus Burarchaeum sp.]
MENTQHRSMQDFEAACRRVGEDAQVCKENKQAIIDFCKAKLAKGSSKVRVVKCAYCLRYFAHWLKAPFAQASKDSLISLVGELESQPYAEYSKYDFKIVLKMFYKWLKGNDETSPPEISWLKPRMRNKAHKLPEELLTEEEVLRLVEAANNPRDKALILLLYETGCRIGELLSLKVKNVSFDQYGAILRVTGKTGDRRVRAIVSAPVLSTWLDHYEKSKEPDAPLWPPRSTNNHNSKNPAEYRSIYVMLRKLAGKAGIRKKIYPHLFRHSRATSLANKLTEAQMKEYFGWTQSSAMASVYVHMSGRDLDDALLKLNHLADPKEEETKIQLRNCHRCKQPTSPTSKFCNKCGAVLNLETALIVEQERNSADNIMNRLMHDEEFKNAMVKKMIDLGLGNELA